MAGDDPAFGIDQHGVGEAELLDAGCDLSDLLRAVGPGVPGIGRELIGLPPLNRGLEELRLPAQVAAKPPTGLALDN